MIVISGGQTGADRAALDAAWDCGLETGGWCPKGFLTVDGPDLSLEGFHSLQEVDGRTLSEMYVKRSMKNVDESDVTIAFRLHSSIGTDKTIGYCVTRKWQIVKNWQCKNLLVIENFDHAEEKIVNFLKKTKPKILNVCGHREIYKPIYKILYNVFNKISFR